MQTLIDAYLAETKAAKAESTWRGARLALEGMTFTQADLLGWYRRLCESKRKPATRNTTLAHVKMFIRWAQDRGELTDLNTTPLRRFREHATVPVVLKRSEIASLAKLCPDSPVGSIVLAAMLTGARKSELESFMPRQVDQDGTITIIGEKTHTDRLVSPLLLGDVGREFFLRVRQAKKQPFRFEKHAWESMRKAAGVNAPFKALRSTVSSYAKSGGIPAFVVDKSLGHTAVVAEKSYDRLVIDIGEGSTLPEFYGCLDVLRDACERVSWAGKVRVREPKPPRPPTVGEKYPEYVDTSEGPMMRVR